MATRSHIGKLLPSGTVKYIYCHYDGYLDHNGRILLEHYNTPERVDQLLELGNLSVLAPEIGEKQDFDSKDRNENYCLVYGRDRGEDGQHSVLTSLENYNSEFVDYVYLYTEEGWKWNNSNNGDWKNVQNFLEKNHINKE